MLCVSVHLSMSVRACEWDSACVRARVREWVSVYVCACACMSMSLRVRECM